MTATNAPIIVLFRNDLRVSDNAALAAASATGKPIVPLFILDEEARDERSAGAASRWWLHHSLSALGNSLAKLETTFFMRHGPTKTIVAEAVSATGADSVFWNRRYSPSAVTNDMALKAELRAAQLAVESFDGFLLHEPSRVATRSGDFYKVFTPFYKRLAEDDPRDPVDAPISLVAWKGRLRSDRLEDFKLLPKSPDWSSGLAERWQPGEQGAKDRLVTFLDDRLEAYAEDRNVPGVEGTSGLSPHLAHGEITPFQMMAALRRRRGNGAETYRKEIAWREFCYHLLFNRPKLHLENFRSEFDAFKWRSAPAALRAWQTGRTGYPIVDAGMRELWQTGWMHNRVRMIAASFLVKDLMIDWRDGEQWFWETLVDADAANNPASWQWVAGSGADAAPYFRIFNPVLQGEKFDPDGSYVRRYIPELAKLPDRYVHRPWEAPTEVLNECGVNIAENYPTPIVDHADARERALEIYRGTRDA
ncbi:deoxyribodipyrimidine photo-lyase [Mesorhizobium sp. INR15]|uniref:cryptochrome/photolyase family protein n=1 Tax=Mesorhizobium sp. INR15 TaxID=2654248 RepID=UPI0018966799|nr:deoxyribodipyrimidine photo-lyase [Mesorhizobium sp. INR15]QPC91556.1 deoxyribodipyrimidine photo-lyase [Mesorhizobium sp. INR15]